MKGIYPRDTSIMIYFKADGVTYRETLTGSDGKPLPPTPKNIAYADKVRQQIVRNVALGTFRIEEYFPHRKVKQADSQQFKQTTVEQAVELFLTSKEKKVAPTTLRNYRSALTHLVKKFGNQPVASIDFMLLDSFLSSLPVMPASHNALLGIMTGFFNYCVKAKLVSSNPAQEVERIKLGDPTPDPLMPDEVAAILKDMRSHYTPMAANYYELAFLIGARPSEMIDLRWANLDENRRILRIDSAKVWGIVKGTKTGKVRDVELDNACMAVLQRQKEFTRMQPHGRIFQNENTGNPWRLATDLHYRFWLPSLARCKIRTRDSRQTRHTCATIMLMAGCRAEWAARQLGHSVEMFRSVYSKWMPELDGGKERGKMAALFGGSDNFTAISLASVSR